MTSALLVERPPALTPTDYYAPVELAAVKSIISVTEPETWLAITFPRPDGGSRVRWAWTAGGAQLGNRIDILALTAGLDAADNFHIIDLHQRETWRGHIRIHAYPLRPILADVQAGVRAPDERRALLRRYVEINAARSGHTPPTDLPRWLGVGPDLLTGKIT